MGEIIAMVDTNNDGQISFDEFVKCMALIKCTQLRTPMLSLLCSFNKQISVSSFIPRIGEGNIGGASTAAKQFAAASAKAAKIIQVQGSGGTVAIPTVNHVICSY